MIIDNNLIAYEYYKNQFLPKEIYPSGEKEETKNSYKYYHLKKNPAILALEADIVNKEGYGLKKGFYSVIPDEYMDFLLLYQGSELKAKVPVVNMEVFEDINPKQHKVKKMSFKKYQRQQEKEYRKYLKGENPLEVDWKTVEIFQDRQNNSWVIIYNSNNISLSGVIKF